MAKQQDIWLSTKLEEFRTLRAEIIDCGSLSISILNFGIVAISGLLYFALTNKDTSNYILLYFCPIICYLILYIWTGEIVRIFRAASYIRTQIEDPINQCYPNKNPLLFWEHWLREYSQVRGNRRLFKWHRIMTVTLFLLTAACSIIIGILKYHSAVTKSHLLILGISEYIIFAIVFVSLLVTYKNISRW